MEVILTRDVPNLGKEGEIKKVAGGYARNYLIPRGFAVPATKGYRKAQAERERVQRERAEKLRQLALESAQKLNGQTLTLTGRTAPNSTKLFGAITADDIAKAIQERFDLRVDKRKIELIDPIRTVGSHTVHIRWAEDIQAEITVEVQSETAEG